MEFDRGKGVQFLGFLGGAQGGQGEHLGLAAGEQAGAMRARADADLAPDRADLGQAAAIGADALVEDARAHHVFVGLVKGFFDLADFAFIFAGELGNDLRLRRSSIGCVVLGLDQRLVEDVRPARRQRAGRPVRAGLVRWGRAGTSRLGLPISAAMRSCSIDQRLDGLVAEHQRFDHHIFGDFFSAAFDHQDGVAGAGDAQVEVGFFDLLEGGVDDEFAVDAANAHGADRARPRGYPRSSAQPKRR